MPCYAWASHHILINFPELRIPRCEVGLLPAQQSDSATRVRSNASLSSNAGALDAFPAAPAAWR
jgi:hypothetical protein